MSDWKRIDGDEAVAARFKAAKTVLGDAHEALTEAGEDYADRCIRAAHRLARAEMILGHAIAMLEDVTGVPWEAIAEDPSFGMPTNVTSLPCGDRA